MKKLIVIKEGVIGGDSKELIEEILPQLVGSFRQRKEFFEYYFDEKEIELSLEDIDNLSQEFVIKINWEELEIEI
jgi:hypothetical protein